MQASTASKAVGALLIVTALLGIATLGLDQILRESAPLHLYALVVFVIIDFIVGGLVLAKPTKMNFTLAAVWSILRILIQIADISQGPAVGVPSYADFANYLFNPAITTPPNAPGVPAGFIDAIIILELVVIGIALSARSSAQK